MSLSYHFSIAVQTRRKTMVKCSKTKNVSRSTKRRKPSSDDEDEENRDEISGDEEGDFEEFNGYDEYDIEVSEFEKSRLENIKKNQEVFEQLGVSKAKHEVSVSKKRRKTSLEVGGLNMKTEKRPREILPPRPKSLRLQNKKPEESTAASFRYDPGAMSESLDPWDIRKPAEMDMQCVNQVTEGDLRTIVEGWFNIKVVKPVQVKVEEKTEKDEGDRGKRMREREKRRGSRTTEKVESKTEESEDLKKEAEFEQNMDGDNLLKVKMEVKTDDDVDLKTETESGQNVDADNLKTEVVHSNEVKLEEKEEVGLDVNQQLDEVIKDGKSQVKSCDRPSKKKTKSLETVTDMDLYERYEKNLDMRLIAKVTKSRAFSIAWYPSSTKRLIVQGDKKGAIGAWDMDRGTGKDSVFLFDVHAVRPVGHVAFDPFDSSKLYSCCYDGTITCGDFNQMMFLQKYAFDSDTKNCASHFAWPKDTRNVLLCATSFGELVNLDLNTGKPAQIFNIGKRMRCIDCHPLNSNLIACANSNGVLETWDWRMLASGTGKVKSLSSFTAGKAITKAYFSPQTGNKILMTSQDHYIRVLDVDQNGALKIRHPIPHRNYVGRWVTTFRSTWDPKTDTVFSCGSMHQPRRVDVFGCNEVTGKLQTSALYSENFTHISPLNVFHPHHDLLASVNSSGRICMWTMPSE